MFQLLNVMLAAVLAGPFFFTFMASAAVAGASGDSDAALVESLMAGGLGLTAIGLGLYGLYALAVLIPSIAVTVRRFHDQDKSGWWYLGLTVVSLIPLVGFLASIALLVFMCLEGTRGSNRFGPDPKDPYGEDVFA